MCDEFIKAFCFFTCYMLTYKIKERDAEENDQKMMQVYKWCEDVELSNQFVNIYISSIWQFSTFVTTLIEKSSKIMSHKCWQLYNTKQLFYCFLSELLSLHCYTRLQEWFNKFLNVFTTSKEQRICENVCEADFMI